MVELTADGLAVKSPPRPAFEPWPVPATTRMECTCLEGPKLLENNGYFYLNVAEGGTGVFRREIRHKAAPDAVVTGSRLYLGE